MEIYHFELFELIIQGSPIDIQALMVMEYYPSLKYDHPFNAFKANFIICSFRIHDFVVSCTELGLYCIIIEITMLLKNWILLIFLTIGILDIIWSRNRAMRGPFCHVIDLITSDEVYDSI